MPARAENVQQVFDNVCNVFLPEKAQGEKAVIQFELSGDDGSTLNYWIQVADGTCASGNGTAPAPADMTLLSSAADWLAVSNGDLKAMNAVTAGKIKVKGNLMMAMKLLNWFVIGG